MRVLLDAKDLINLERGQPRTLTEFRGWLEKQGSQLVLTLANVLEFAAPLGVGRDLLQVRATLQALESLPLRYLGEQSIVAAELGAAVKAFDLEIPLTPIDPYVDRWDKVMALAHSSGSEAFVNYRLDEIVFDVWRGNPTIFRRWRDRAAQWRSLIDLSRDMMENSSRRRTGESTYWILIERHLRSNGVTAPQSEIKEFAKWLYADPSRCPAIRLLYEVLEELRRNVGDKPRDNDLADLAYVQTIPYVDTLTLDGRMAHYCRTAAARLWSQHRTIDYGERIYSNLEILLSGDREAARTDRVT